MSLELNWNEWRREDTWKPSVRIGAAMLSSVLILVSVQETEPVYLNGVASPGTTFQASVLNTDGSDSSFLEKAVEIALERKSDAVILSSPAAEIAEADTLLKTAGTTNIAETAEITSPGENKTEPVVKAEENISQVTPVAASDPDLSGNVKEEENVQEIVPVERIDETVSDENGVPGNEAVPAERADTGYLIDDAGMIYGISGDKEILNDGVLILPTEGCTGIAAGALSILGAAVEEIEIPANITEIQPGAFAGLSGLGWIEADAANPSYSSADGVLYTADGTGLHTFPAAWTGLFQVPGGVRYFAENAFDGTNLDCIDARACVLEQTGKLPETVEFLQ